MKTNGAAVNGAQKATICAIYVRKSTDENLQGDFTTLDNQAEYCRSFIKTREPMGWQAYPEVYSDAGYSGKNVDRPALKKLMADARLGKFKVVVCYKYDRLTRNTRDFLEILALFEERGIDFVSVTQPIDTTSPVGRLMRSILMEFAQFEREMISERTRDKLRAMIKKGKWTGGPAPLGFDLDREAKKILVNEKEAEIVRDIFEIYSREKSLSVTAERLNDRGVRMKAWTTREGRNKGGRRFFRMSLSNLLHNTIYIAKRKLDGELYPMDVAPVIDEAKFRKVQEVLDGNRVKRNSINTDKHDFLLKGLVRCAACGGSMTPHFSRKRGQSNFLYYRCTSVNRTNRNACPVRAVRARALEQFVIDQIKTLAHDEGLVKEIAINAAERAEELPGLRQERDHASSALAAIERELPGLMSGLSESAPGSPGRATILERIDAITLRRDELRRNLLDLEGKIMEVEARQVDAALFHRNLAAFTEAIELLDPKQKKELVHLMIKEVVYDKPQSRVRLGFVTFQDYEWEPAQFSLSLDTCKEWLRD
ncbi:MAG: recombinase family protein [Elusimicrobiota bacterium]